MPGYGYGTLDLEASSAPVPMLSVAVKKGGRARQIVGLSLSLAAMAASGLAAVSVRAWKPPTVDVATQALAESSHASDSEKGGHSSHHSSHHSRSRHHSHSNSVVDGDDDAGAAGAVTDDVAEVVVQPWFGLVEVSTECSAWSDTMVLACELTLTAPDAVSLLAGGGDDASLELTVRYWPAGSPDFALFTTTNKDLSGSLAQTTEDLYRLRPSTTYMVEVHGRPTGGSFDSLGDSERVHLLGNGTFVSEATGWHYFDSAPLCDIDGDPLYQVMMFDLEVESENDDGGNAFEGAVMVDAAGYVVWYADTNCQVMGFDQFPDDHSIVLNTIAGVTSSLVRQSADGTPKTEYDEACVGTGADWSQINHEARVSPGGGEVYTVYQVLNEVPTGSSVVFDGESVSYYLNDQVALWRPGTGEFEVLFSIADYVNPVEVHLREQNSMTVLSDLTCGGDETTAVSSALDFSHTSAISQAADHIIVSLRNINAVLAFDRDGRTLQWAISSNPLAITSNFSFASENDLFYNVHDAQLVGDPKPGDTTFELLLFDGGNNRPGCRSVSDDDAESDWTDHCYSRAIKYSLDLDAGTATVDWQFEYSRERGSQKAIKHDDVFVWDGGSVQQHSDVFYVGFTSTEARSTFGASAYIFEVDSSGEQLAEITIARRYWSGGGVKSGLYRTRPFSSVHGEQSSSPLRS